MFFFFLKAESSHLPDKREKYFMKRLLPLRRYGGLFPHNRQRIMEMKTQETRDSVSKFRQNILIYF